MCTRAGDDQAAGSAADGETTRTRKSSHVAVGVWGACAACCVGLALRLAVYQTTHAFTASVDACRTLCELLALLACLLTTKYGDKGVSSTNRLYNSTYGLSRGTIVASLSSRILFASLSLSLLVAALQSMAASAGHEGVPHAPSVLFAAGGAFSLLAGLRCTLRCLLSRRGRLQYTLDALLLSAPADLISSIFMTISAATAISGGSEIARLADPALAVTASMVLVIFDCSEIRATGLVLLQASPQTVPPAALHTALLGIKGVHSVHELHAWQLTPKCLVATAHIVYETQIDYMKSRTLVTEVFVKYGIKYVTIQPEFSDPVMNHASPDFAMDNEWCAYQAACSKEATCGPNRCCPPLITASVPTVITKL